MIQFIMVGVSCLLSSLRVLFPLQPLPFIFVFDQKHRKPSGVDEQGALFQI